MIKSHDPDATGVSNHPDTVSIRQRVLSHFVLKFTGSTVAITAFFIAYFHVLDHPLYPVRTMPVFAIDRWIPLWPWTVWIYFTLWAYICLPHALMCRRRALGQYLVGAICLGVSGLLIFTFYPTAVPDWGIDWARYPAIAFLKESDAAGNACPSLHVSFAVFAGLWLNLILKALNISGSWRMANGIWCVAIAVSTLSTRQHVFIDVAFGAVLGALVFSGNRCWLERCWQHPGSRLNLQDLL